MPRHFFVADKIIIDSKPGGQVTVTEVLKSLLNSHDFFGFPDVFNDMNGMTL